MKIKGWKKMMAMGLVLLGLSLSLAACGGGGENAASSKKMVSTDGSTSMEKVIGSLGEAYMAQNDGVTVAYNPTGSSSGISAVREGRCDIGLSSRALTDEEKAAGLRETVLAYDGIAVIVHPENTVDDLTMEELAAICTGEITDWSELGGTEGSIVLIGREAGSGTRDGFETITATEGQCRYRQELTSTGDVIATVSANPNAIGYASLATVDDTVKVLCVNGVEPSEETIQSGSYAIQRPFVLVTKADAPLSAAARGFFDYVISDAATDILLSVGIVPAAK